MIEYDIASGERDFYVVFDKRREKGRRFFHLFTSKDWNHVYLFTRTDRGTTMVFKPTPWYIMVDEWDCEPDYAAYALTDTSVSAILQYTVFYQPFKYYRFRGIYNCITLTKALLDIQGFFIWTPKQLYNKLIKLGATHHGR